MTREELVNSVVVEMTKEKKARLKAKAKSAAKGAVIGASVGAGVAAGAVGIKHLAKRKSFEGKAGFSSKFTKTPRVAHAIARLNKRFRGKKMEEALALVKKVRNKS